MAIVKDKWYFRAMAFERSATPVPTRTKVPLSNWWHRREAVLDMNSVEIRANTMRANRWALKNSNP